MPVRKTVRGATHEVVRNRVLPNYYVKVGLLRAEAEALRQIARRPRQRRERTVGQMLQRVMLAALLHWDKLEPHLEASERYAAAEGFGCLEIYGRDQLTRAFPRAKRKPRPKV